MKKKAESAGELPQSTIHSCSPRYSTIDFFLRITTIVHRVLLLCKFGPSYWKNLTCLLVTSAGLLHHGLLATGSEDPWTTGTVRPPLIPGWTLVARYISSQGPKIYRGTSSTCLNP